jgi:streptomycin 6-kinase
VVLKLSSSEAGSARAEAAALRIWGGVGAPALLYEADDGRVILLQAITPGTAVEPHDDSADAGRAAGLLRMLHRDGGSPAIPDATEELRWRFARAHRKLDGPSYARDLVSHRDIDEAHRAAVALHVARPGTVLCHGDFINKNLLLDEHGDWWAIDPRPCLGDPCLDAAFWALAHRPGIAVEQRCRLIAEAAGLSAERTWQWAQAFAISESVLVTDELRARAHHRVAAV